MDDYLLTETVPTRGEGWNKASRATNPEEKRGYFHSRVLRSCYGSVRPGSYETLASALRDNRTEKKGPSMTEWCIEANAK